MHDIEKLGGNEQTPCTVIFSFNRWVIKKKTHKPVTQTRTTDLNAPGLPGWWVRAAAPANRAGVPAAAASHQFRVYLAFLRWQRRGPSPGHRGTAPARAASAGPGLSQPRNPAPAPGLPRAAAQRLPSLTPDEKRIIFTSLASTESSSSCQRHGGPGNLNLTR